MSDWAFHPTLVAPFYLQFMGGNIATLTPAAEQREVLDAFRQRAPTLTDAQLGEMLASSWRPEKVAAWAIAYLHRSQFLPEIARRLMAQPSYTEHFCICLARLGGEKARDALHTYLEGCASGALQLDRLDETVSPDWALVALEYLDASNAPAGAALWQTFVSRQPPKFQDAWEDRLARVRGTFTAIMQLFDANLQV